MPDTPESNEFKRESATAPPEILFMTDVGAVLAIPALRGDRLLGAVWITLDQQTRPRAGIMMVPTNDPKLMDVEFQQVFGDMTLQISRSTELEAQDFADFLMERYTPTHEMFVGTAFRSQSLDELTRWLVVTSQT